MNQIDSYLSKIRMIAPGPAERGSDQWGKGGFAVSRGDGRLHPGRDYAFKPGEVVCSPVSGTVRRLGYCYNDDLTYRLVEILDITQTLIVRLLYLSPSVEPGQHVTMGDELGQAQDITRRYGRGMTNHVHCEVFADPRIFMHPDDYPGDPRTSEEV